MDHPRRIFTLSIILLCLGFHGLPSALADEPTGEGQPAYTNRLAKESSPYLLQHAHNPVDWYPWGEEAFAKARREGKLVFLSVGYAACHWCHVMERESFMDEKIANVMNEKFVCIKVDREERPDVDQIYMTAVQLISGQGGWPMSVFLLPDGRPFWGGTYFPARDGDRGASTGFMSVLNQIEQVWENQRDKVTQQADTLTSAIKSSQTPKAEAERGDVLGPELVLATMASLFEQYDPVHGGFGVAPGRPKFPEASNLIFLLDRARRESVGEEKRASALMMLTKTLDGMISGAMYDHLGGGFHRYSVDQKWQIPHFEKMLYDNGQLMSIYAEAFAETQRAEYRHVVEGIGDFVIRELRAPGGGFYSALDADSEGEEGKFYRWTAAEIADLKSEPGFELASDVFHLQGPPNFEGEFYAPDPRETLTAAAQQRELDFETLTKRLKSIRTKMFEIRSGRERPITDVKILTAWNGLMVQGLADAGRILNRPDYIKAATQAADFLLAQLRQEDGRVLRSFAAGEAKLNGYVDDYAFLARGLQALHQATGEARWLNHTREITDQQLERFWDEDASGFFFTSSDHPELIVRVKDPADGAIPAGNSVSLENLRYLAEQTGEAKYQDVYEQTLQSLVPLLKKAPSAAPRATAELAHYFDQQ
ncbi:MAG: thioredoxin domain-containing protein [Planctomycetaceae bacterium]|nr:thioredoxin domain-containing protein [Planctomycetaceae bacterium]